MDRPELISYAQNQEDVVLHRALGHIDNGFYVDVGANHPRVDSVTRLFYELGWSGIAVEPNPEYARMFRSERPRDTVVEAAVTDRPDPSVRLHMIAGTGLSTIIDGVGQAQTANGVTIEDIDVPTRRLDELILETRGDAPVHFISIDTEGAELEVLRSLDLNRIRPWIILLEAIDPVSHDASWLPWEPLLTRAGYGFALFDGLSRFYVADEADPRIREHLAVPASVADGFRSDYDRRVHIELDHWKQRAQEAEGALALSRQRQEAAEGELSRLISSRSWRLTRPLRSIAGRLRHR